MITLTFVTSVFEYDNSIEPVNRSRAAWLLQKQLFNALNANHRRIVKKILPKLLTLLPHPIRRNYRFLPSNLFEADTSECRFISSLAKVIVIKAEFLPINFKCVFYRCAFCERFIHAFDKSIIMLLKI